MVSQLSLDILDTRSIKTLRVADSSLYNSKIKVECPTLEVIPPGFTKPTVFTVKKGFNTVLNSSNLKIKKTKVFSELQPLPDGVYRIKYSIKPNEDLWVEYEHLRVELIMKTYFEEMCSLKLQTCEPENEIRAKLNKLSEIRSYIEAARGEVEYCGHRQRGVELYEYAQKLLNTYKTSGCLTCK